VLFPHEFQDRGSLNVKYALKIPKLCVELEQVPERHDDDDVKKKKEAKKILKYKDLTIEIQHLWNVKMNMIPVIIGATETVSKSFRKCIEQHTRKP
jgi:hypothetical protein